MIPRDEPLVIACSGGPDSTAAALAITRVHHGPITLAHFDHGLRGASDAAAECTAVDRLGVMLGTSVLHGRPRRPLAAGEASARVARYRWLAAACHTVNATVCVVAHTLDDHAETVLLRLTRGTGQGGVAGIAPHAAWPVRCRYSATLRLLRPLLGLRRAAVVAYLADRGVGALHDPTNDAVSFARNRVRHRVLPELRAINPRAEEALLRHVTLAAADAAALDGWARSALEQLRRDGDAVEGGVLLHRAALRALPPAVAARVVRQAAAEVGLELTGAQTDAALHGLTRAGVQIALVGGELHVMPKLIRIFRKTLDPGRS